MCSNIVIDPLECCSCEALFCKNCIEKHTTLNIDKKCPNCRSLFKPKENVSRLIKNVLNDLKFNCPLECGDQFTYEKKESHMNKCMNIICIACDQKYDKTEFIQHIENCPYRPIHCLENDIYFPLGVKIYYERFFMNIILNYKALIKNFKNIYKISI